MKRLKRHKPGETRPWVGAEVMGKSREQLLSGRPCWVAPGQWLQDLRASLSSWFSFPGTNFPGQTEAQEKSRRLQFLCLCSSLSPWTHLVCPLRQALLCLGEMPALQAQLSQASACALKHRADRGDAHGTFHPSVSKLLWVTAHCRPLHIILGPRDPWGNASESATGVLRCRFSGLTYCIKVSGLLLFPQGPLVLQM